MNLLVLIALSGPIIMNIQEHKDPLNMVLLPLSQNIRTLLLLYVCQCIILITNIFSCVF
jgi:hypothetical protein